MSENSSIPILIPIEPEKFWENMRLIIREEIHKSEKNKNIDLNQNQTPGLTYKPLFKMAELCNLLQVTRPTIYEWIKEGKLKPYKIKTRVYFLWNDVQALLQPS